MKVWLLWHITEDKLGREIETLSAICKNQKRAIKEMRKGNNEARRNDQDYRFEVEDEPRIVLD